MRIGRVCSALKSDPSRVDYTDRTPSLAGLVDDMMGDSDRKPEHTSTGPPHQLGCRFIFRMQHEKSGE